MMQGVPHVQVHLSPLRYVSHLNIEALWALTMGNEKPKIIVYNIYFRLAVSVFYA